MNLRQKTFHVVPNLVNPVGPRPPMTSRAAKKAYKAATRGPKISRAEQRKLDEEEIARQKREHERERAAEKAKAAREKKAAKAEAAKQDRKKKGIPEKSKWVTPSQPYITGFIKQDAPSDSKRKRGEDEDRLDNEPPNKMVRFESPSSDTDNIHDEMAQPKIHSPVNLESAPTILPPSSIASLNANLVAFDSNSEDEATPSAQLLDMMDDLDDFPSNTQVARELSTEGHLQETSAASPKASQHLPQLPVPTPRHHLPSVPQLDLTWLSSQDLTISSQDLRDINTPCKVLQEVCNPSQKPRLPVKSNAKPRFFVEKEEDLLHAALEESKRELNRIQELDEQESRNNQAALRRSTRKPLERVLSTKSDYGDEGIDDAMLALLAEAEGRPSNLGKLSLE